VVFGLGTGELIVIIIAGLVIFGPERLPKVAADAGRVLRQLRRMADDVRADLKEELGPELADLDLASLSPRGLIQKHLLDPALDDVGGVHGVHGVQAELRDLHGLLREHTVDALRGGGSGAAPPSIPGAPGEPSLSASVTATAGGPSLIKQPAVLTPYDADAT